MGGFVILGMLAAFGLVCAFWVLAGFLLQPTDGTLIWVGEDSLTAARRYLWLREMGLSRDTLILIDVTDEDREWFAARGIEICSREEILQRLKTGEKEIDAGA